MVKEAKVSSHLSVDSSDLLTLPSLLNDRVEEFLRGGPMNPGSIPGGK
jgi:hypothetical protein